MQVYTDKFKKAVVKKVLIPGVKMEEVAQKLNVTRATIRKWINKFDKELQSEIEKEFLDSIQPEEEEEVDIDKMLIEIERKDLPTEKLNQEQTIDKILSKGKLPTEYTHQEKYIMVNKIRSLKEDEAGMFYRRTGIHNQHIKLWEEELLQMGKKELDKTDYIKKLEEENKKLQKQLKESEKEKTELKVLIGLKKKYRSLFKEDEEN